MKNLVWKLNCLRCSLVFHDQKLYDEHIKVHDTIIKRKSTEIDKISYDRHCSTDSHKIKELNLYTLNNESISKNLLKY